MVAITSYNLVCANKLCLHEFKGSEVTWPPTPTGMKDLQKVEVCPKCGFKTGSRFPTVYFDSQIIAQYKELTEGAGNG